MIHTTATCTDQPVSGVTPPIVPGKENHACDGNVTATGHPDAIATT